MTLPEGLGYWALLSIPLSLLLAQAMYNYKVKGLVAAEKVRIQEQDDAEQLAYLRKWKENRL